MVTDSNRENLFTQIRWSPEVRQSFSKLQKEYKRLKLLQDQHHVVVPLVLNPAASGLVEAWAKGYTWEGLLATTNMDSGDLVRVLRRTADVLRQLSKVPDVPKELSQAAKLAHVLINKDPVREVETMPDEDSWSKGREEDPPPPPAPLPITHT
jgi:superfamily II RNA helicase